MKGKVKWLLLRKGLMTEYRAKKSKWVGKITIGHNLRIGKNSILDRYMGGSIELEDNVSICEHCKVATCGGDIFIGEGTVLGDYTTITAQGG